MRILLTTGVGRKLPMPPKRKLLRTAPHRGHEAAAAICAVIRRIPKGWVATYGQVAAMAGLPRRARLVGHVLQHLDPATDIPWHRVVNAKGEVSVHPLPQWQRRLPAALAGRGRRRVRRQEPLQLGAIPLARIEMAGLTCCLPKRIEPRITPDHRWLSKSNRHVMARCLIRAAALVGVGDHLMPDRLLPGTRLIIVCWYASVRPHGG